MADDDALTAAIAEVHAAHAWQAAFGGCSEPCGWQSSEGEDEQDEHAAHVAEQIAQVVREHTAAKQAEALTPVVRMTSPSARAGTINGRGFVYQRDLAAVLDSALGAALAESTVGERRLRPEPDQRPCRGHNSNVCVAEGCYGEACLRLHPEPTPDGGDR